MVKELWRLLNALKTKIDSIRLLRESEKVGDLLLTCPIRKKQSEKETDVVMRQVALNIKS